MSTIAVDKPTAGHSYKLYELLAGGGKKFIAANALGSFALPKHSGGKRFVVHVVANGKEYPADSNIIRT